MPISSNQSFELLSGYMWEIYRVLCDKEVLLIYRSFNYLKKKKQKPVGLIYFDKKVCQMQQIYLPYIPCTHPQLCMITSIFKQANTQDSLCTVL